MKKEIASIPRRGTNEGKLCAFINPYKGKDITCDEADYIEVYNHIVRGDYELFPSVADDGSISILVKLV